MDVQMTNEQLNAEIIKLKKEKDAVILAHYYQRDEIQAISDHVGDSFALSKIAKETDAKMIVFCGVRFMAETAKILSPQKKVLLANTKAGCPMADMITVPQLKLYKEKHPDTKIICYVNSSAEVKALCDVCVTSSNALQIIKHFQKQGVPLLYVPDENLATYANSIMEEGMPKLDTWPGYCRVHDQISVKMVKEMKEKYPDAEVLIHPEAPLDVLQLADYVGSTLGIIKYAKQSKAKTFLIGTEKGIMYPLKQENPDKTFIPLSENLVCYNMKYTTLADLYLTLKTERNEIILSDEIIEKASKALNLMLEFQKTV